MTASHPARRRIPRPALLLLLAAALLVATLYLASLTANLSVEGDNGAYIILAKALATGHGYTNIQEPLPRIETQYPPLFPLLLLPIVAGGGTAAVLPMQLLVTLFALASFALTTALIRQRTASLPLALAVTLAAASSSQIWSFSHKVLTEIPYLCWTLAACLAAAHYARAPGWRAWSGLAAILAATSACLTRTIGFSLCLALPAYLLCAPPLRPYRPLRRRCAKALALALGILLPVGGWTIRSALTYAGTGHNYLSQFFLKQAYVPDDGRIGPADLLHRLDANARYYEHEAAQLLGYPTSQHALSTPLLAAALTTLCLIGFAIAALHHRTVAEIYVPLYAAAVLIWPWQGLRFAVPLTPFLLYYLALACQLPFRLRPHTRPHAPVAAALLIAAFALPMADHTLHAAHHDRTLGYHPQDDRLGEWPAYPDWRDFHAAALWLRSHAPAGSTVVCRSPNLFYLWTGIPARNYPYTFDHAAVLRGITADARDFVLADDFTWTYTTRAYLRPTLRRYPAHFQPVYTIRRTTVYRVLLAPTHAR